MWDLANVGLLLTNYVVFTCWGLYGSSFFLIRQNRIDALTSFHGVGKRQATAALLICIRNSGLIEIYLRTLRRSYLAKRFWELAVLNCKEYSRHLCIALSLYNKLAACWFAPVEALINLLLGKRTIISNHTPSISQNSTKNQERKIAKVHRRKTAKQMSTEKSTSWSSFEETLTLSSKESRGKVSLLGRNGPRHVYKKLAAGLCFTAGRSKRPL